MNTMDDLRLIRVNTSRNDVAPFIVNYVEFIHTEANLDNYCQWRRSLDANTILELVIASVGNSWYPEDYISAANEYIRRSRSNKTKKQK